MRQFLFWLLALGLAFASPPSGQPPKDAKAAFAASTNVFVGRVAAVRKDAYGQPSLATVMLVRTLKGKKKGSVEVSGQGGPTYPARVFKKDEVYLFYLGDDLHADSVTNRVVLGADMKADLTALGL